jgi:peroxiredoxin
MPPRERLRVGDAAPALTLPDAAGQRVELSSKWQSGPTLLTFLRHFG